MTKAIALLSGGLDSLLSVIVMKKLGIDITAVTFLTHFGCDISDSSSCSKDPSSAAEKYGFQVKLSHLGNKFVEIVKNPEFGHGKNMNPCMDCRILMLKEAKEFMKMTDAHFIITGEVLGQRPMSQRRDSFPVIDKKAGLQGLILRPLSAKLLKPTVPELKGIVDREKLYDFSGRTRKPQIALAKALGLTDYLNPAGGCLLTDPFYSKRLRELLAYDPAPNIQDINLLKLGRHFRASPETKVIVGRNKNDNSKIITEAMPSDYLLKVNHHGSPITLLKGQATKELIHKAASLCARYSSARTLSSVEVSVFQGNIEDDNFVYKVTVNPLKNGMLEALKIQ